MTYSKFLLAVKVTLNDKTEIVLENPLDEEIEDYEDIYSYMECDPSEDFNVNLQHLLQYEDIDSVVRFLRMALLQNDDLTEYYNEEDLDEEYSRIDSYERTRQIEKFLDQIAEIDDLSCIEKVEVRVSYEAGGSAMNNVILNDDHLHQLARDVLQNKNESAEKAFRDYLENADYICSGNTFADTADKKKYHYNHDLPIDNIAQAALSSLNNENGTEIKIINLKTKEYESYAEINLI